MKLLCTVTGYQWHSASGLAASLASPHPVFALEHRRLRELATSGDWPTLNEADKRLLWAALLASNPLTTLRSSVPVQPTAAVVDATIDQLVSLTAWVRCQHAPAERFPGYTPTEPECVGVASWLAELAKQKSDTQAERESYTRLESEREEVLRMDNLLARWQHRAGIDSEALPTALASWLLSASAAPVACVAYWQRILTRNADQLLAMRDFLLADLTELIEHLDLWIHPTHLRRVAVRQLSAKLAYCKANALTLEDSMDWLVAAPKPLAEVMADSSPEQPKTFQLVRAEAPMPSNFASTFASTVNTTGNTGNTGVQATSAAERTATIMAAQAEMAARAKARLAAIRAAATPTATPTEST